MLSRLKWIKIPVSVFRFKCIELEDSPGPLPTYMEENIPRVQEPPSIPTIDENLDYVTDNTVKSKAQDLLNFFRTLGPTISVDAIQGAISVKKSGRVFRYVYLHRKKIAVGSWLDGQWSSVEIGTDTDLDEVKSSLKASFEQTGGERVLRRFREASKTLPVFRGFLASDPCPRESASRTRKSAARARRCEVLLSHL
jgi:hypothetical protein